MKHLTQHFHHVSCAECCNVVQFSPPNLPGSPVPRVVVSQHVNSHRLRYPCAAVMHRPDIRRVPVAVHQGIPCIGRSVQRHGDRGTSSPGGVSRALVPLPRLEETPLRFSGCVIGFASACIVRDWCRCCCSHRIGNPAGSDRSRRRRATAIDSLSGRLFRG